VSLCGMTCNKATLYPVFLSKLKTCSLYFLGKKGMLSHNLREKKTPQYLPIFRSRVSCLQLRLSSLLPPTRCKSSNRISRGPKREKKTPTTRSSLSNQPALPHRILSSQLQNRHRCDSTGASHPVRRSAIGRCFRGRIRCSFAIRGSFLAHDPSGIIIGAGSCLF
jgi:hypothetical protein